MKYLPRYLKDDEAKKYWQRHAPRLHEAGLLTEADTESFVLLCEVWSLLRQTDMNASGSQAVRYIALLKQYQSLAKQFGLLPKDRKTSKLNVEKQEQDEFGL